MAFGAILGGAAAMIGGGLMQDSAARRQGRAMTRAANAFGAEQDRLGTDEIGAARQQAGQWGQLAGQYNDALRGSINRFGDERSEAFHGQIGQAMQGLDQAGIAGLGPVPAPPQGAWGDMRMGESQARLGPAQDLQAMLMGNQGMQNYDDQTNMNFQNSLAALRQYAGMTDQQGMMGRAVRNQEYAEASNRYDMDLANAQRVGSRTSAFGALLQGAGGIALTHGIGNMGSTPQSTKPRPTAPAAGGK